MYGLAIFLLVIAIIPTALFTASSKEALEEAAKLKLEASELKREMFKLQNKR